MTYSPANTIWVLLGAALVFFMQAGFAMCEAGFTRAKNTGNILMKNLMDFCIGTPLYWLFGFGIMFGAGTALFGRIDLCIMNSGLYADALPAGVPLWAFAIFQTVFCATSATIVSGAMAERTKFSAYCIYSAAISLFIYPVSGHWIWGGGWLAQMGFHDFAGSTAVHMVGGVCALVGAKILGPRTGKYDKDGKPKAILGHNLSIAALGVFILWFCWFGFNGASTVSMEGSAIEVAGLVFFNTNLAAAVATLVTMIFTWVRYGKPDVSMTFNAALAGLVGITAGCDAVDPFGAAVIGAVCGIAVVLSVAFFDKVARIDDPVGAISVHGVCGCLGTLLTGFFSTGNNDVGKGLFYGGGFDFLGVQCLGVVSTIAWTAAVITIVFLLIKKTIGLRADAADEIMGLDRSEHGLTTAYAGFSIMPDGSLAEETVPVSAPVPAAEPADLPRKPKEKAPDAPVYTRVQIICRPGSLEKLKAAMNGIGITGMTVTNVMGYGAQKGKPEYYRGTPVEVTLLPKVQVDIVVSKVPVREVIDTARSVLHTGHIGDGKIFVQDVENVVRVRTGEEGYDALQGD